MKNYEGYISPSLIGIWAIHNIISVDVFWFCVAVFGGCHILFISLRDYIIEVKESKKNVRL